MNTPKNLPEQLAKFNELFEFMHAIRRLRILGPTGEFPLLQGESADNAVIDLRSLVPTAVQPPNEIPDQGGNAGKVLGTNGATVSWVSSGSARTLARIDRVATQACPNATFTTVIFDTATENANGAWVVGSPTRITVPAGWGGEYLIYARLTYQSNGSGSRYIYVLKNGVGTEGLDNQMGVSGGVPTYKSMPLSIRLVSGDYLELQGYQDSGGALNFGSGGSCILKLLWLGP